MVGIYIHIPFCQKKCSYCDFYSVVNARQIEGFVQALLVEIRQRSYELSTDMVETIYLGGGTPSLLNYKLIDTIITTVKECYNISKNAEITIECNPGDVSQIEVSQLIKLGINRFSVGVQSFHNPLLKTLGRRHSSDESFELYNFLRTEGATNISLDLIYSIPGSSLKDVEDDVLQMIALSPEHISTYDLIYEQGTPFAEMRNKGEITPIPEDVSLQMSHSIDRLLKLAGYEHYEISNYSKKGFRSRHNSIYWSGGSYLGFGPSAHSYIHPWRSWNVASLNTYNRELLYSGCLSSRTYERLSQEMIQDEYFLTRLRTCQGISINEMATLDIPIPEDAINRLKQSGLLKQDGDRISLTEKGVDVADRVIIDIVSQ